MAARTIISVVVSRQELRQGTRKFDDDRRVLLLRSEREL